LAADRSSRFLRRLIPVLAAVALIGGSVVVPLPVTPAGAIVPGVPSPPLDVQASAASDTALTNGAIVTWTAPISAGEGDVTSYAITPFDETSGATFGATTVSGNPPDTTGTVSGLVAGDNYTFTVTATNGAGPSAASAASNAVVPVALVASQSDSASSSSPTGSATAWLGTSGAAGSIAATGSGGEGTLTVATYPSAPIGGSFVEGAFYDVSVVPAGPVFTQVTVVFCGAVVTESLKSWDPDTQSYVTVSDQTAPTGNGDCVTVTMNSSTTPNITGLVGTVFVVPSAAAAGYVLTGADGGVFALGGARYFGSLPAIRVVVSDVVAVATTSDGGGYWLVGADGGVFAFGDARFHGSLAATRLNAPIVAMAPTPDGGGYWLVAADGGVFAFGDARFSGSVPGAGIRIDDVTGIAASPDGGGYWLVGADGGVFAFGTAVFSGSLSAVHLVGRIVGIAPTANGGGYWLVGTDGGVFAIGDARFVGSLPATPVRVGNVVGIIAVPGSGYLLIGADGGVYAFGDAGFHGSIAGTRLSRPVVGGGDA
jgi:hypothetical protein